MAILTIHVPAALAADYLGYVREQIEQGNETGFRHWDDHHWSVAYDDGESPEDLA